MIYKGKKISVVSNTNPSGVGKKIDISRSLMVMNTEIDILSSRSQVCFIPLSSNRPSSVPEPPTLRFMQLPGQVWALDINWTFANFLILSRSCAITRSYWTNPLIISTTKGSCAIDCRKTAGCSGFTYEKTDKVCTLGGVEGKEFRDCYRNLDFSNEKGRTPIEWFFILSSYLVILVILH